MTPQHLHLHRGAAESVREYDVAEIVGPYAWSILHHVAKSFPCTPCARHADRLMRGLHDLVNAQIGKQLHDPDALQELFDDVVAALKKAQGWGTQQAAEARAVENTIRLKVDRADRSIEQTVERLAQEAGLLAASAYPQCSSDAKSKWERCIRAVKGQPHVRSPYAVCTVAVGCSPRRKE